MRRNYQAYRPRLHKPPEPRRAQQIVQSSQVIERHVDDVETDQSDNYVVQCGVISDIYLAVDVTLADNELPNVGLTGCSHGLRGGRRSPRQQISDEASALGVRILCRDRRSRACGKFDPLPQIRYGLKGQ